MEDDLEASDLREVQLGSNTRHNSTGTSVARQMAVNFMPSRQLPYNTLRHRRHTSEHNGLLDETDNGDEEDSDPANRQAEIIVKELEQQRDLMDDNPVSEELRREALRGLPQGLTMKRSVRTKLSASVSLCSKRRPISLWKRTKYRISFAWKRGKDHMRDTLFSIELWYEALRNIEGQFGTAVGSYFRTIRRLLLLDLAILVLLVALVAGPQIAHDLATEDQVQGLDNGTVTRWGLDWITGQGGIAESTMFYGHYHSGRLATWLPYHMPFAYFFTMLCVYLLFFVVLCYRTAYSYRRNFISTAGGLSAVFANKLFSGWDYGIVSQRAATLHATTIYHELKELLNEQNKKKITLSVCTRVWQRVVNMGVSVAVVGSIGGVMFGLWRLLIMFSHWQALVSATVVAVVTCCPALFHLVGRLEYYTPRTAVYVALVRTWLLDMAVLMLLFFYWSRSGTRCWETRFGQESYRLVFYEAIVSLLVLPVIELVRGKLHQNRSADQLPEFNVAYSSLTLIYSQSVMWLGMLFSPLLPLTVAVKFFFLFYVKRECAIRACQPARKAWRAAQTQTVLYTLVTLSLFTTLFGLGALFLGMESPWCGPFREYGSVWSVMTQGVLRLEHRPALAAWLARLTRPGVIACLGLLLCVWVYYWRARARAQAGLVRLLRRMLALQAKDKDFLLGAIDHVSRGEWLYSPKPAAEADSHTFRYMREVRQPSNASFHLQRRSDAHDSDSSFTWQGGDTH